MRGGEPRATRIRTSVSTFLQKLFEICTSNEHRGVITWSDDGLSFEVVSRSEFEKVILPTYFKHANMNSFVRQLNMYDFHKRRRSSQEIIFYHEFFVRGRRDLLSQIKRKTNSQYAKPAGTEQGLTNEPSQYLGKDGPGQDLTHQPLEASPFIAKAPQQLQPNTY